jgi:hypothetical protein
LIDKDIYEDNWIKIWRYFIMIKKEEAYLNW